MTSIAVIRVSTAITDSQRSAFVAVFRENQKFTQLVIIERNESMSDSSVATWSVRGYYFIRFICLLVGVLMMLASGALMYSSDPLIRIWIFIMNWLGFCITHVNISAVRSWRPRQMTVTDDENPLVRMIRGHIRDSYRAAAVLIFLTPGSSIADDGTMTDLANECRRAGGEYKIFF